MHIVGSAVAAWNEGDQLLITDEFRLASADRRSVAAGT
jgi:hypothetical protein